jgi:hypothetical protein
VSSELEPLIEQAEKLGLEKAIAILKAENLKQTLDDHDVLTIVGNRGAHHLPETIARGFVFYASEGNLDFSSGETVAAELTKIVSRVSEVLKAKRWKRVYLVPFGHAVAVATIKLVVYRVCHLETIDLFHHRDGTYSDIQIVTREIIGAA